MYIGLYLHKLMPWKSVGQFTPKSCHDIGSSAPNKIMFLTLSMCPFFVVHD